MQKKINPRSVMSTPPLHTGITIYTSSVTVNSTVAISHHCDTILYQFIVWNCVHHRLHVRGDYVCPWCYSTSNQYCTLIYIHTLSTIEHACRHTLWRSVQQRAILVSSPGRLGLLLSSAPVADSLELGGGLEGVGGILAALSGFYVKGGWREG